MTDLLKIKKHDGSWSIPAAVATTDQPQHPVEGQLWFDPDGEAKGFGTPPAYADVGPQPDNPKEGQLWFDPDGEDIVATLIVSPNMPTGPVNGRFWFNPTDLCLRIWLAGDNNWFAINEPTP